MNINYKNIIAVTSVSILLGLTYNFLDPNGIPIIRTESEIVFETQNDVFEDSAEDNSGQIRALTTDQVYAIFTNKEARFVDGRDSWDFADGHIPGAINIPEYKFTPQDPSLKLLDKNDKIIVYCEGNQCEVSKRLAGELKKLGYKKVWVYLGGWQEWWEMKLPIEKDE